MQEPFYTKMNIREVTLQGNPDLELYLMRGLPGSGKSTKMKEIFQRHGIPYTMTNRRIHIVSNDDYSTMYRNKQTGQVKKLMQMTDQQIAIPNFDDIMEQKYHMVFDPSLPLKVQKKMKEKMEIGITPLIFDNTFLNDSELVPAVGFATMLNYTIHIIEFDSRQIIGQRTAQTPVQQWSAAYKSYRQALNQRARNAVQQTIPGSGKNITQELLWTRMIPTYIKSLSVSDSMLNNPEGYRKRILKTPRNPEGLQQTVRQFIKQYNQ